ncbi:tetratricopeptide repeat protein, partial [Streptomyces sp. BE303]|uniref:tetratricopeptide repeat protein n=1 Tax=Streptomyces sp. BE303 TaxID=3002528 RepID=UPI002E78BF79
QDPATPENYPLLDSRAHPAALPMCGESHRLAVLPEEAMADLTAALALSPSDVWALRSRGQAHRQAGRPDEAVTDLTAAVTLNPSYAWAFALRGEVHRLAGVR